jgi:uncharacterized protein DUF2017
MTMASLSISPAAGGGVDLGMPKELRELVSSLARQLDELLRDPEAADDPGLARLFPPAAMDDPMQALGFEQLMGQAIKDGKLESAAIIRATADATHLSTDEAHAWMRGLNDIRLLIGTRLAITEDTDIEELFADPLIEHAAIVYVALTELVELLVRATDPG